MLDKNLKPWIEIKAGSDFSIHNIPFGVYSDKDVEHHVCTAIGDYIVDLFELESRDLLDMNRRVFDQPYLNPFIELGKTATNKVRNRIIQILCDESSELKNDLGFFKKVCKKQSEVKNAFASADW